MMAILLIPLLLVGNNDPVVSSDGRTNLHIQKGPNQTYNVYTDSGRRLGSGQESPYGTGDVEFFRPNGDRWFTAKPTPGGTTIIVPKSYGGGGGGGGRGGDGHSGGGGGGRR